MFVGHIKKYRFAKKSAAQESLMKHLGGYIEHQKAVGEGAANTLAALLQGMRGSALPVVEQVEAEIGV